MNSRVKRPNAAGGLKRHFVPKTARVADEIEDRADYHRHGKGAHVASHTCMRACRHVPLAIQLIRANQHMTATLLRGRTRTPDGLRRRHGHPPPGH